MRNTTQCVRLTGACRSGLPPRITGVPHARRRGPRGGCGAGGFTLIELLVVVAIIVILLSIVIVAMSAAARGAQKTNTQFLMNSIKAALVRFEADVGYFPPVLGPDGNNLRDLYHPPVPPTNPANYGTYVIDELQDYWSSCALAEYLIGYGHHQQDGYGWNPNESSNRDWEKETPALGIRHPGSDGVWGATIHGDQDGSLGSRMKIGSGGAASYGTEIAPYEIDRGKVLGPYLELKESRLLAAIHYGSAGMEVYFPGDPLPPGQTWESMPKAIVDYWGMPIRYYRRPYPPGSPSQAYRSQPIYGANNQVIGTTRVPTLADVFVLRPWDLPADSLMSGVKDGLQDQGTTLALSAAEFALFSSGPDRSSDDAVRRDDQPNGDHSNRFNADNIVEVGP